MQRVTFNHAICGNHRPQIVLIGNGLERDCTPIAPDPKGKTHQLSWDDLVDAISVDGCISLTEAERKRIPFPLLYSLLSVPAPAPSKLSEQAIYEEEKRLKDAMGKLSQVSTWRLEELKTLGADHILTTNYSYGLEQSFLPNKDFMDPNLRSKYRFNLNPAIKNKKPKREVVYRMHSGYLVNDSSNKPIALWHIHGECSVSRGVVLGHDRYGRVLSRIEQICDAQDYDNFPPQGNTFSFCSWPQLFLYGDIYVVGFSFDLSEFDLWWLLKRKQREQYGDGCVYFYEHLDDSSVKQKMLMAHGVKLQNVSAKAGDFDDLYQKAFEDIRAKIKKAKEQ